jgi:hypothetical protein
MGIKCFITFGLVLKVEDGLWARERWFLLKQVFLKFSDISSWINHLAVTVVEHSLHHP